MCCIAYTLANLNFAMQICDQWLSLTNISVSICTYRIVSRVSDHFRLDSNWMHLYGIYNYKYRVDCITLFMQQATNYEQTMPDGAFTQSWSHCYKKIRNLTDFSSAVVKLELAGIAFRKNNTRIC